MKTQLEMFVVYENPLDFPDKFVVRRWPDGLLGPNAPPDPVPLIVCDSLEAARAAIPPWAVCLQRHPEDDPAIREVWL